MSIIQSIVQIISSGFPKNRIELNGNNATFGIHCDFRKQFDAVLKLLDESGFSYDVDNDCYMCDVDFIEKNVFLVSLDITDDTDLQCVKELVEMQKQKLKQKLVEMQKQRLKQKLKPTFTL
jgi:hypothetical protein